MKNSFLILVILLIGTTAYSQLSTQSLYSGFGIGQLQPQNSTSRFAAGGVNSAWIDRFGISAANPASFTQLAVTTFQFEGFSDNTTLTNSETSQTGYNISGLDNFMFVFKKKGGKNAVSLGLRKYATTGYNIVQHTESVDYGKVDYFYEGRGNINAFNLGFAREFRIKKFNGLLESPSTLDSLKRGKLHSVRHKISIGANLDWYFGKTTQISRTEFDDPTYQNTSIFKDLQINDINYSIGFLGIFNLYDKGIINDTKGQKLDIATGISFKLGNKLNGYQRNEEYSGTTLTNIPEEINGSIDIPQQLSIGLGLLYENKKGGQFQWSFDYTSQNWTNSKSVFGDETTTLSLDNSSTLGFGFEYKPKGYSSNTKYFNLITYRLGGRLTDTYVNVGGKNIGEQAVTAGLTFPLVGSGSYSNINFGMEFGTRGTTDQGLIKEDFTNFMIGFTFTPFKANRWFVERKYD